jgi:hypothetical protein
VDAKVWDCGEGQCMRRDEATEGRHRNGECGRQRPSTRKRMHYRPHLLLVRLGGGLRDAAVPSLLLVRQ